MKMTLKILITAIVGFGAGWLCLNVLNLDAALSPVISALIGAATYTLCEKFMDKGQVEN